MRADKEVNRPKTHTEDFLYLNFNFERRECGNSN